jgi:hypothetical protein
MNSLKDYAKDSIKLKLYQAAVMILQNEDIPEDDIQFVK